MTDDPVADLLLRWEELFEQRRDVSAEELCRDCPELAAALGQRIADLKRVGWVHGLEEKMHGAPRPLEARQKAPKPARPFRRGTEVIPGYRLGRHLGRGGFGHVWAVDCPDGQQRAVKIMHNPVRACMELTALDRIRGIDHPMILSIHRIEATADSLMVVVELADGSLGDLFAVLRRNEPFSQVAATGLSMLQFAAEALDCLQSQYDLLHLDVKPANLLHVGRVWCKVGDLGTFASLRAPGASGTGVAVAVAMPREPGAKEMTTVCYSSPGHVPWGRAIRRGATVLTWAGAFTPYYAPPEAFAGKISRSFDQYSLALTFCELVAGKLPFTAEGEKQVAQRARGEVELAFLPPALRPIIARALSPRPEERLPSCRALVRALYSAGG